VKTTGHTYATVTIYSKDKSNSENKTLLVDTGSTFTWIRKDFLNKLNIKPEKTRPFRTIEGKIIERNVAEAIVEYDGEEVTTIIVFGNEKDQEVLGVYTLEGLGYMVDSTTRRLKKVDAHLAV
jgi:clan AA aspartic protease